jgi:hypothetical protein
VLSKCTVHKSIDRARDGICLRLKYGMLKAEKIRIESDVLARSRSRT